MSRNDKRSSDHSNHDKKRTSHHRVPQMCVIVNNEVGSGQKSSDPDAIKPSTPDPSSESKANKKSEGILPQATVLDTPMLKRLGREEIKSFLIEWKKCQEKKDRWRSREGTAHVVLATDCVDKELLQNLVDLQTFPSVTSVSGISQSGLIFWLQNRADASSECMDMEKLAEELKEKVKMNIDEPDADCRVRMLFVDYLNFLRLRNMEKIIEINPSMAVKHIFDLLKPEVLKRKIYNDQFGKRLYLRCDWIPFFKCVLQHAIAIDSYVLPYEDLPETKAMEKKEMAQDNN